MRQQHKCPSIVVFCSKFDHAFTQRGNTSTKLRCLRLMPCNGTAQVQTGTLQDVCNLVSNAL
eukprot:1159972-Pelagomonas_calceolata.AAC.3